MSNSTNTPAKPYAFSAKDILTLLGNLPAGTAPGGYMLICPDGKVYTAASYEELIGKTAHMHAYLKLPLIGKTGLLKP